MKITISKSQWEEMGRKARWITAKEELSLPSPTESLPQVSPTASPVKTQPQAVTQPQVPATVQPQAQKQVPVEPSASDVYTELKRYVLGVGNYPDVVTSINLLKKLYRGNKYPMVQDKLRQVINDFLRDEAEKYKLYDTEEQKQYLRIFKGIMGG